MKYKKENKAATKTINNAGGDGNHLSIEAPKLSATPTKIAVAVPMLSVLWTTGRIREGKYCVCMQTSLPVAETWWWWIQTLMIILFPKNIETGKEKIKVLIKRKKEYRYDMNKAKQSIHQKSKQDIDFYVYDKVDNL